MNLDTKTLYHELYNHMGPQGWWPADTKVEIMLGAILVQNTNWRNAAYAIESLKLNTSLEPQQILNLEIEALQKIIRSSGFYKSKAQTIHALFRRLEQFDFDYEAINKYFQENLRKELLSIKGIGSETADVLLVYIFGGVEFIPDSYTRRIYYKLGYDHTTSYEKLKKHVILPDSFTNQEANEFHALLDNFGKAYFNGGGTSKVDFLEKHFVR